MKDKKRTYTAGMNLPVKTMPVKVQKEMQEKLVGERGKKMKGSL